MIHYKSIDQSQFAEGTDIKEQERVFDDFLQDTLLEIQGSHTEFPIMFISATSPMRKFLISS